MFKNLAATLLANLFRPGTCAPAGGGQVRILNSVPFLRAKKVLFVDPNVKRILHRIIPHKSLFTQP
jgi:hypothetical protein